MFTGAIEVVGQVEKRTATTLSIRAKIAKPKLGASIAVNGCCLTLVETKNGVHRFDVGPETWKRTNLGDLKVGQSVNVEPALRIGDSVSGHFVAGHVDAAAKIISLNPWGESFWRLRVELPKSLSGLVAEKGSIAMDGISLTVTTVAKDFFEVMLIPHTLTNTTLGRRKVGSRVNLEADPLARYALAAAAAPNTASRGRLRLALMSGSLLLVLPGFGYGQDLIDRLFAKDYTTQEMAAQELRRLDEESKKKIVLDLSQRAEGTHPYQRIKAIEYLGSIGPAARDALPSIIRYLKVTGWQDRREVLSAIVNIGPSQDAAPILIPILKDKEVFNRVLAARALGQIKLPAKDTIEALAGALEDSSDAVSLQAAYALANNTKKAEAAVPTLFRDLKHNQNHTRFAAAYALKKIKPNIKVDITPIFQSLKPVNLSAHCETNGKKFDVIIRSFSGEWSNDDETVWITGPAKPLLVDFGETDAFGFLQPGNDQSLCDNTLSVPLSGGAVLVLLLPNNRPWGQELSAFAYDPANNTVLDSIRRIGANSGKPRLNVRPNGIAFESKSQPSDSVACRGDDCKAGPIFGQKVKSISDDSFPVWWDVIYRDRSLSKRLDRDLTWQETPLRKFFTRQSDFEKAFKYNASRNEIGIWWYRIATLGNGTQCLFPSPTRDLPSAESQWICPQK